jgi:hypothetical protein
MVDGLHDIFDNYYVIGIRTFDPLRGIPEECRSFAKNTEVIYLNNPDSILDVQKLFRRQQTLPF